MSVLRIKYLFLFNVILFLIIIVSVGNANKTIYNKNPFDKILSRNRRFIVYPPGSGVLITFSTAKALQLNYPRGINLVLEVDFYYPVQMKLADFYPKMKEPQNIELIKSTTSVPSTMDTPLHQPQSDRFNTFTGKNIH